MIRHRLVGVRDRNLAQRVVTCKIRGVEQHLEVHHIVDDNRKHCRVRSVPTARAADNGVKARREGRGECLDGVQRCIVERVSGQLHVKITVK